MCLDFFHIDVDTVTYKNARLLVGDSKKCGNFATAMWKVISWTDWFRFLSLRGKREVLRIRRYARCSRHQYW